MATVIKLSDQTKELFGLMSFPEIPDEAKYIAFLEDGNAQFLSEFSTGRPIDLGSPVMVSVYKDVDLTFAE